jgi:hypothetical protein
LQHGTVDDLSGCVILHVLYSVKYEREVVVPVTIANISSDKQCSEQQPENGDCGFRLDRIEGRVMKIEPGKSKQYANEENRQSN